MSGTVIAENVALIHERIISACERSGRNSDSVRIVAVTKYVEAERIRQALQAGVGIVGENRVQEAWQKYQQIEEPCEWHMIGHLQTNKVKRVLKFAHLIHSVDSFHLAEEIDRQCERSEQNMRILIQVNTSGEASKFGIRPAETLSFVRKLSGLHNIRIAGLMTIGAYLPNPEDTRHCFKELNELRQVVMAEQIPNVTMDELSMGMTNDFEVAVEEGATLIRVGRLIFGERNAK